MDAEAIERSLQATAAAAFDWQFVSLLEIWMASRTEPSLHEAFSQFEARNAAIRLQSLKANVGEDVVAGTDVGRLMGGFNFILRGLFLQQILGGDWRRSGTWLFWRRRLASQIKGEIDELRERQDADRETVGS